MRANECFVPALYKILIVAVLWPVQTWQQPQIISWAGTLHGHISRLTYLQHSDKVTVIIRLINVNWAVSSY